MFARLRKVSLQIWKVSYIYQQNQMHIKLKEKTLCLLFSKENFSVENATKIARLKFGKFYQCTIVGNKAEGRISKQVTRKQSMSNFPKNDHFIPLIRIRTFAYQGVRHFHFSENLACFVFLLLQFWDSPFCLIIDEMYHP